MSKDFWNSRYSEQEFAYGTQPNAFFKEQLEKIKSGSALFLGEGEGRNAVYAATL
ncbi:MAG: SAM-dependent methyltransferase, partial [Ignavibacterium sp.]